MANSNDSRSDHERQLDAIINRYYEAVEQGDPPDQTAFIAQHPEFAAELRDFFADLGNFHGALPSANKHSNSDDTLPMRPMGDDRLSHGAVVRYFGEYEILEQLGVGGMGVVYKAWQTKVKRIVALKMIRAGELATAEDVQRFENDARCAANLTHPGIVAVHEVGLHDGKHFFTMDYVDGGSLAQLHRDEPVPARRAADLLRQLAEAVHYAHGKGIIHRDLKPANIVMTNDGIPRITDFGLAKRIRSDEESIEPSLTQTGQILGTAGYMPPEQASGKMKDVVGPLADIYSLGAVLYALLTSRAPFVGESTSDTLLQVLQKEPISPRLLNPSVPRDLETICLKCLNKEPGKRYGTAQLVADDLTLFQKGCPINARPAGRVERTWRWCRRNRWIAGLAAGVAASLLIGTIVSSTLAIIAYRNKNEADQRGDALAVSLEDARQKYEEIVRLTDQRTAALDEAQWQVYRLRMIQMEQLWQRKDWGHLERLLTESIPASGQKDLRGWEWYYLQAQLNRRTWRMDGPRGQFAIDWDHQTDQLAVYGDGAIEIWRPSERKLLKSIAVSTAPYCYYLVRWCPDHRHLAIATGELKAHVIDTETGKIISTLTSATVQTDDKEFISYLDWSPHGDFLAVTLGIRGVQIWKVAQGSYLVPSTTSDPPGLLWNALPEPVFVKSFDQHDGVVSIRMHWSSNQVTCVTTSNDGWVMSWNTGTWTLIQKERLTSQWCGQVVDWSPDGLRMALGSTIVFVANSDGTDARNLSASGAPIRHLRWLDNERIVTANEAQEIRIVNIDQKVPDEILRMHSQLVRGLSVGPQSQIASEAPDESIKIWSHDEITAEQCTLSGGAWLPSYAVGVAWHPQLTVLGLVSKQMGGHVAATWSPKTPHLEVVPLTHGANSVHWSFSGDTFLIEKSENDWQALQWPRTSDAVPTATSRRTGPTFSSDGRFRVDAKLHTRQIAIIDTSAKLAPLQPDIDVVYAYAWHPYQPYLAITQAINTQLYHPLDSLFVRATTPRTHAGYVTTCLAWSRDGKYLISGSNDSLLRVMDGTTLDVIHVLSGHTGAITAIAVSNDGSRIVSAGRDGFLRWWDAVRGVELFKLPIAKSDNLSELSFSADGLWLAGRTERGKINIWTTDSNAIPLDALTTANEPAAKKLFERTSQPMLDELTAAIEAQPDNREVRMQRGRWYLNRQMWADALADHEAALQGVSETYHWDRANLAALHLRQGNIEAYQQLCRVLVAEMKNMPDDGHRMHIVRLVCLSPIGVDDYDPILEITREQLGQPDNWFAMRNHPGVLCRAGLWRESMDAAIAYRTKYPTGLGTALPMLYEAIALQKLGESDAARKLLTETKIYAESQAPNHGGPMESFANDALLTEILFAEASQLILGQSQELALQHPDRDVEAAK